MSENLLTFALESLQLDRIGETNQHENHIKIFVYQNSWLIVQRRTSLYFENLFELIHILTLLKPQRNSLQYAQNVGWRKNFDTNLCPLTSWMLNKRYKIENKLLMTSEQNLMKTKTYVNRWTSLIAPRRLVISLARVFCK